MHLRDGLSALSETRSAQSFQAVLTFPPVVSTEGTRKIGFASASPNPPRPHTSPTSSLPSQPQPNSTSPQLLNGLPACHIITPQVYGVGPAMESLLADANEPERSHEHNEESSDSLSDTRGQVVLAGQNRGYITTNPKNDIGNWFSIRFVPDPQTSGMTIRFIMSQYEALFELIYFQPIQNHIHGIRRRFITRIVWSNIAHWSMYIGAQMFRALRQDRESADVARFVPNLNRLGQLSITSKDNGNLDDLTGQLAAALELAFLLHLTSNVKFSYTLLRHIAPIFMQVAFADPTLWPRDPSSSGISLSHALASPLYELGRFIFADTASSLLFGTAPLVEYDTSYPVKRTEGEHIFEWTHGWPPEFICSMVKINQWRAQHPSYSGDRGPWEEIEADTLAWRSTNDHGPDSESSRVVMRFAIQESWRHALLIYLYMAMCGVNSHDLRVQLSVQQISRLYATVNSEVAASVHLMIPFLLAGACTQDEADRRKFRAAVSRSGQKKTWLFKMANFEYVLDHLWHGAGVNGGPVTWDDYVRSRQAVIDIGV